MSSTNLTDERSSVCFFMINCERNHLKAEEKAGDASKVNPEDAKNLSTNLGVSTMVIPQKPVSIDEEGRRSNNSQIKDMKNMDYKRNRMRKINKEKLKEKSTGNKNPEANEHEI